VLALIVLAGGRSGSRAGSFALGERRPLQVAISSRGEAPMVARWLRETLEATLDEGLGTLAEWLGARREALRSRFPDTARRRQIY